MEDVLQGVYSIILALPTEESPIFLALNLNNLPCLYVKNVDDAALVCHQSKLSETIIALKSGQEDMKTEIKSLREIIRAHFCEAMPRRLDRKEGF